MPGARGRAINELANAVATGHLDLDPSCDLAATKRSLRALPGIGDWTTEYIAMRVLGDPNAFPAGDLGLQKALLPGTRLSERVLRDASKIWKPWRAYAALALWKSLGTSTGG
jgi:AraC family transcriptional regulator of adaptative response / DNA-3-methyladenine glycosylase II